MMKPKVSYVAALAELMATCLFVYIGTGTATTFSGYSTNTVPFTREGLLATDNTTSSLQSIGDRLQVNASWGITTALAFGFAITVLAYATAHLSGGQLNPAVSAALACVGALPIAQAILNICCQIVGAILGSSFLYATIPASQRLTLGSNQISNGVSVGNALCGEAVMTFVLVSVVLETAVNKKSVARAQAPLAIGFAVFCAHAVLLPIDGCSINPARSLGPAIVSGTWPGSFWVFIVGPFLGAAVAIPFHLLFRSDIEKTEVEHADPVDLRVTSGFTNGPDAKKKEAVMQDISNLQDIVAQAPAELQDQAEKGAAMAAGGGLGVTVARLA